MVRARFSDDCSPPGGRSLVACVLSFLVEPWVRTCTCVVTAGHGSETRQRNRIRQKLTTFFKDRDCLTLVRPLIDEEKLQVLEYVACHQRRCQRDRAVNGKAPAPAPSRDVMPLTALICRTWRRKTSFRFVASFRTASRH